MDPALHIWTSASKFSTSPRPPHFWDSSFSPATFLRIIFFHQRPCLFTTSNDGSTSSLSARYAFVVSSRSRPYNSSYLNSTGSGTPDAGQSCRQIVFSRCQLCTSFPFLLVGFALHNLGEQILSETVEDLIVECDKLSLHNNDLERLLLDSQAKVGLVRAVKSASVEWIKTLRMENRVRRAER